MTDLVVFLLCQQVVERFVDGLVVVTLDRPQVGFDQLQLIHLVEQKQPRSYHVNQVWNCVLTIERISWKDATLQKQV